MVNSKNLPFVSIVIITRNVERTIGKVLQSIAIQNYPKSKTEILVIDGNSTDRTHEIVNKFDLPTRIIQSKYPNDPEACRGVGLQHSKGEIIAFVDSDNYLPNRNWLNRLVEPFLKNPEIVGSQPWRFAYLKKDFSIHRYFALIGSADPVGLYLNKADKISHLSDKWTYGSVLEENRKYLIVEFDTGNFPTLGSNGFLARKKMLLKAKSDPKHYFHIDVPYDLCKLGYSKYAVVKEEIVHDTATGLLSFVLKRGRYMKLHYQKRAKDRRYKVFDPKRFEDIIRLAFFVVFSLTLIQPLYVAIKGYLKKRDLAWFIHPIFCFLITVMYASAIFQKTFRVNK